MSHVERHEVHGRIIADFERPPKELVEAFARHETAKVADAMGGYGVMHHEIKPLESSMRCVGTALTVLTRPGDALFVQKAIDKYLFRAAPLHTPVDILVEGDRLAGLVFEKMEHVGEGNVRGTGERFPCPAPLTVSSIGSLPVPLPGLPMQGEFYRFVDGRLGTFQDLPNVFTVGNAVTGKGNLVVSRKHASEVAEKLAESIAGEVSDIAAYVRTRTPLDDEELNRVLARVRQAQERVDYDGDYETWMRRVSPPGLRLDREQTPTS